MSTPRELILLRLQFTVNDSDVKIDIVHSFITLHKSLNRGQARRRKRLLIYTAREFLTSNMPGVSNRSSGVASFKVMDVLRQANHLQAEGHAVLHCEVGQPGTGAPQAVAKAAVEALTEPAQVMGYTDAFGLLALREKISAHCQKCYPDLDQAPPSSRIVVTTGSSGGFLLAFTACFDAGDAVAIASSGYPCYRNILSALDCELAHVSVNEEFKLTAKELKAEIVRRAETGEKPIKGLILSSPSNPTGAMLAPDELRELCQLCDEFDIQVRLQILF